MARQTPFYTKPALVASTSIIIATSKEMFNVFWNLENIKMVEEALVRHRILKMITSMSWRSLDEQAHSGLYSTIFS